MQNFFFPDGIVEYLDSETKNFTKINDKTCHHKNNFDDDKGKFEFAIQWHNEISEFKISFCNSVPVSYTHLTLPTKRIV